MAEHDNPVRCTYLRLVLFPATPFRTTNTVDRAPIGPFSSSGSFTNNN